MNQRQRIVFIINPKAGVSPKIEAFLRLMIQNLFQDSLFEKKIEFTKHAGHATALAAEAIAAHADYVIAAGGDGTINEVARALVNTDTALGVLPMGSGNGFARHLGISMNLMKAIKVIRKGKIREIDTINVNGYLCISIAGIGFDAAVAQQFALAPLRGLISYTSLSLKLYRRYTPRNYTINIDGENFETSALMINMANGNQFGFNAKIAPHASMDDGLVDVCITSKPSITRMVLAAPYILLGRWDKTNYSVYRKGKHISMPGTKGQMVNIDGECVKLPGDLQLRIEPRSLRVIVP